MRHLRSYEDIGRVAQGAAELFLVAVDLQTSSKITSLNWDAACRGRGIEVPKTGGERVAYEVCARFDGGMTLVVADERPYYRRRHAAAVV